MADAQLDVVVVSAIGVDTTVFLSGQDVDFTVEANFTSNLDCVGQAGGYSSRGFAQLGYQTGMIGFVGDDFNGQCVRHALAADGIKPLLFVDPEGTRRSVNFMSRDGRRKNFYDGRGAMHVRPDLEECHRLLSGARLAHFNIENWARYLLPLAKQADLTISCDVQDLVTLDDPYRQDFIAAADILFFSAVNLGDLQQVISRLLEAKPGQIIVVGMGPLGCALATSTGLRLFGPARLNAPIVDTNGAGDGLAVGFLSSYVLRGLSLDESILRGQIVAYHTCTQRASTDHLITQAQLETHVANLKVEGA